MNSTRRKPKPAVIWVTIPDADPKAIQKAFFLLFRPSAQLQISAETKHNPPELDKTN